MNGAGHILIRAYGVTVRFESGSAGLLKDLKEDFAFFSVPEGTAPDIRISAQLAPPDPSLLKGAKKIFKTSKWTVFKTSGGTRAVLYPEGLAAEYDYRLETGRLSSADPDLLREMSYLLILSRLGEKLDLKGLHRATLWRRNSAAPAS